MRTSSAALLALVAVALLAATLEAANQYVRPGATGAVQDGSDWTKAWSALPAKLVRGDTYYLASGNYESRKFDDAEKGTAVITIKKATAADHGTEIGWKDDYGRGQAVFADNLTFATGYWTLDGNVAHDLPSNRESDYGIKISTDSLLMRGGIVRIDGTDVTIKDLHIYCSHNGSENPSTRSVWCGTRTKVQNCWLHNSGMDGILINTAHHVLVERCYLERLGKLLGETPNFHGQTVMAFWGKGRVGCDVVLRWNVWDRCEGQALVSIGGIDTTTQRLRFYGNVVMNPFGTKDTAGFNSSGGIIGNAWTATEVSDIFVYNNTLVNLRDSYTTVKTSAHFYMNPKTVTVKNCVNQNNLFYNCKTSSAPRYTAYSHNASGGLGQAGGTDEQTDLPAAIFRNYETNDFRLKSDTKPGVVLAREPWWSAAPDPFFGQLDYDVDMAGVRRGAAGSWSRGAFQFTAPPIPPATPGKESKP